MGEERCAPAHRMVEETDHVWVVTCGAVATVSLEDIFLI